jgi:cytochrome c-type biogenesis protein
MTGVLKINLPSWFGGLREKIRMKGLLGALLLGLISGLVASQCATPVLAAILTYVMAQKTGILYGAALLFIYALGRGVPIVLAGTFTGVFKGFTSIGRWSETIEKVSGGMIILVGLYFLWIA